MDQNKVLKDIKKESVNLFIDAKIHIYGKNGIYRIVDYDDHWITITCNKWWYENFPYKEIPRSNFKCLAGGLYNFR